MVDAAEEQLVRWWRRSLLEEEHGGGAAAKEPIVFVCVFLAICQLFKQDVFHLSICY